MPKPIATTFAAMLEARLRWALESSIIHFRGRPDRNTIEDWAYELSNDMALERHLWERPAGKGLWGPVGPVEAPENGKVPQDLTSTT
jgi:hypothetical protein